MLIKRYIFKHWRRKWQSTPVFLSLNNPGTEEPGGLLSMRLHRVGHNWSDLAAAAAAYFQTEGLYIINNEEVELIFVKKYLQKTPALEGGGTRQISLGFFRFKIQHSEQFQYNQRNHRLFKKYFKTLLSCLERYGESQKYIRWPCKWFLRYLD